MRNVFITPARNNQPENHRTMVSEERPRVCNSFASEIPLWFASCQSLSCEKIASPLSILLFPLPPLLDLSYSASARNPFASDDAG